MPVLKIASCFYVKPAVLRNEVEKMVFLGCGKDV